MNVSELRCTSCLAPIDPSRGAVQHCVYCGATLTIGTPQHQQPELRLESCGSSLIGVIKAIRENTGLGLKEAKELAESAPCVVAQWNDLGRMERFHADLAAVGAVTSGFGPAGPAPSDPATGPGVFLEACGPNKINVIKCIREATGLGLKDAKDLADAAPCAIPCGPTRTTRLRDALIEAGARVRR